MRKKWNAYNGLAQKKNRTNCKPRRDLVDETMVEIINKKRFITCHSYVQSEINMLMEVAERFNFRINTFTHILEGYKVADKMKQHGAAASTLQTGGITSGKCAMPFLTMQPSCSAQVW
jgi:hypothetical protein